MRHIIFRRARVEEWALRPFSFLSGGKQHWSTDAIRIDRKGEDRVVRVTHNQIPLPVNTLRTVVIKNTLVCKSIFCHRAILLFLPPLGAT